jgi:hypothetical protein
MLVIKNCFLTGIKRDSIHEGLRYLFRSGEMRAGGDLYLSGNWGAEESRSFWVLPRRIFSVVEIHVSRNA